MAGSGSSHDVISSELPDFDIMDISGSTPYNVDLSQPSTGARRNVLPSWLGRKA